MEQRVCFCRNGVVAERLRSSYDSQACEAEIETKSNKVVAFGGKGRFNVTDDRVAWRQFHSSYA